MKILVAEDDIKISSFLSKGLTEENYTVDSCFDGEEALYLIETNHYDLIILDLMIPYVDGLSLCKILREKNIKTPIIMLTAKSSIEEKVLGLNSGANDYISKPFSFDELLARIKVQLRADNYLTNVLQIGDLKMDTDQKTVSRNDKNIQLSSKEYTLLKYLLFNKEKVVTEDMINNSLWHMDKQTASNIINVYIYRLRKKIDKDHDTKLIHTVREWVIRSVKIFNLDNIKTKLVFYYSIVVTVILALFSVILLDQFYIQNVKTVDKQLNTVINEINYDRQFYKKFDHDEFMIKNLYITTYKYENNKFSKISSNNPDLDLETLKSIPPGEFHRFSARDKKTRIVRFHSNRTKNIYIEAATTLDDKIEPAMDHLKHLLLVWIPALMILSIILGYYIIKESLSPVKNAVHEVKDIESHNLNKRISSVTHNDEIEELITTFNFMLDKLDESFCKIKRFSNDVSHELKTPLTIIRGEIELGLRKERSNEEYKQILKSTLEETRSLQELINNLLFLSKTNNKELQEQFKNVEIDDLLTEIISQNKQLIESKNINFAFKSFESTVVKGHPFLLKILIGNIIQNSIKYSHKNSTIEISLDKEKLSVKDYGIGIKQEDLKNIFDRFYRVDDSRNGEGFGLGLSIVKSIASIHKFPIDVKSSYGEYTLFTLIFKGDQYEEQ